jgi:hypothetical protein
MNKGWQPTKIIETKPPNCRSAIMNNKTILNIQIKQRGDGVYDLYVDGAWKASRGHYENILDEVRSIIQQIDAGQCN